MKKFASAALAAVLLAGTLPFGVIQSSAAEKQYEFEDGSIVSTGENSAEVSSMSGASGGKAVDLKDGGNKVSVRVEAAEAGPHRITIRYSQP